MRNVDSKNSIDFFMSELQAKRPSPGGGAVAALVGALGVGLIIKVTNYTLGKKGYERYEKELKTILIKAKRIKKGLNVLIKKDARAYGEYSKTKTRTAMRKAIASVAEISKLSNSGLKFYRALRRIGNVNLKGDLEAGGMLLSCSIRIADNLVNLNKRMSGSF